MATAVFVLGDSKRCVSVLYVLWPWEDPYFPNDKPFSYTFLERNFSTIYTLQIKGINELKPSKKY
jgi:hypothetical protein